MFTLVKVAASRTCLRHLNKRSAEMPELSSIVRGDPRDEDPALLTSIADLTLGEQESLFLERITPDIFSFFILALQFQIPHHDLPTGQFSSVTGGRVPQSVFLGHGISSNVSVLRMEKDLTPDCTAGGLHIPLIPIKAVYTAIY